MNTNFLFNTLSGSFSTSLANKELEVELLSSHLLQGILYSPTFVQLVEYLADYPHLVLLGDEFLTKLNGDIKAYYVEKDKLNLQKIKMLYKGEDNKLLTMFLDVLPKVDHWLPIIHELDYDYTLRSFSTIINNTPHPILSRSDYDPAPIPPSPMKPIIIALNKIKQTITLILELLQTSDKVVEIKLPFSFSYTNLPFTLFQIQDILNQYPSKEIYYVGKCMNIVTSLQTRYPKLKEDPYQKDVFLDIFSLMKNPLKIFQKLKTMVSVDDTVPILLKAVYNELLNEATDQYWDVKNYMTYQQQLKIDRGLGVLPPVAGLATLCETYLYIGYNE